MRPRAVVLLLASAALLAGCVTPPPGEPAPPPRLRILGGLDQLYPDPDNAASRWVRAHPGDPKTPTIKRAVADRPSARWFTAAGADLTGQVEAYVGAAANARMMPLLVTSFVTAGQCPEASTSTVVDAFVDGVGDHRAIVVLEPGLLGSSCETGYLDTAVGAMRAGAPNALILIDATAEGIPPMQLARRLASAGLAKADGFTLNVGGYAPSVDLAAGTAKSVRAAAREVTGRDDYLVLADSARNGAATVGATCNPSAARVGPSAAFSAQPEGLQQAWLTLPGTSDGPCGLAPDSRKGDFVPALVVALIAGTS